MEQGDDRVFCVLSVTELYFFIKAAISIFGIIGGPLLGLFTLGIICPFANSKVSPYFLWVFMVHFIILIAN